MSEMEESESEESSNSSDEDWEEVKHKSEASESDDEMKDEDLADYNPVVSQEGIQVKIETEDGSRDKKKKDWKARKEAYLRLKENRRRRKVQINLHKSSFLIHFSRGVYLNNLTVNDEEINCIAFSLLPFIFDTKKEKKRGKRREKDESTTIHFVEEIETNQINQKFVKMILKSYRDRMKLDPDFEMDIESESDYFKHGRLDEKTSLVRFLDKKVTSRVSSYSLGFISILRSIRRLNAKLQVRLCLAIKPIEQKPQLVLSEKQKSKRKKPGSTQSSSKSSSSGSGSRKESGSTQSSSKSSSSGFGSGNSVKSESVKSSPGSSKSSSPIGEVVPVKRSRRASSTSQSSTSQKTNSEAWTSQKTDSQSSTSQKTDSRPKRAVTKKTQVISEESEETDIEVIEIESSKRKKLSKGEYYIELWTEIYLVSECKWIPVDPVNNKIGDGFSFSNFLITPDFNYVTTFDDHGHCREVTPRYTSRFMLSEFKRLRVDDEWMQKTMRFFQPGYRTKEEEEEEIELKLEQECQPLPTSVSEFKNHPLYLLGRHLLVSEVIHGQDGKEAIPVGTFRGESVYSRKDVHPVKSKEYWMRSAKVVREDEEPAKTVKGRKKWDKYSNKYITDIPKFLYGEWQTDPFIPPTATNGKVPKNTFGNVELFQPQMIPFGCVHLRVQGLTRVAGKLGIDFAQAVVGFDNAKHGVHPVYDGYVVCEEFKELLLEALEEEKREKRKKEAEKKEKRVINNWKKLIKAVLIRERLRKKYQESS